MSHQVSQGLVVGWRQLQQTLMDGLQSGLSILQLCGIKIQIAVRHQEVWRRRDADDGNVGGRSYSLAA